MKLYRKENIDMLIHALELDEFDDDLQDKEVDIEEIPSYGHAVVSFFTNDCNKVLEVGCGSGGLFPWHSITHAVEPNKKRYKMAKAAAKKHTAFRDYDVKVKRGVVEALPYKDNKFDAVVMINGFFQVRSDYEALIEINRVLKVGGHFIFNLMSSDVMDIIQGRVYGADNYVRTTRQFGFDLSCKYTMNAGARFYPPIQTTTFIAVEKKMNFDIRYLNQPQVDVKFIKNYLPERDWVLI